MATGLPLTGSSWNRPNDTFGLAGVVNGISQARRTYLDAGGSGILIGDGRHPNPGPEKIIESFHRLPVWSWRATLNYQLVVNSRTIATADPRRSSASACARSSEGEHLLDV